MKKTEFERDRASHSILCYTSVLRLCVCVRVYVF